LYRIVRYPGIYLATSILLVALAMSMVIHLANRDIEEDLDVPLAKTLGAYAATLEAGTINSRAMGAAILFGLESHKAKQAVMGKLPPDDPELLSELNTIRTLYIADLVYLVNKQGRVVAYSSKDDSRGIGRDLSFRPYVQLAVQGTANVYPAVGVISPDRGIYLAAPLRTEMNNTSATIGAVVVKVGADKLDSLLKTWMNGIAVLLSPQGVVFSSNREDWQFRITGEVNTNRIADIQRTRQFGNVFNLAPPQSLSFTLDTQEADIDGIRYVVRSLPLDWNDPEGDWMLAFLEQRPPWWTNWSVAGYASLAGLFTALALFWFFSLIRNAILLKNVNSELFTEMAERKRADAQITKSFSLLNATLESAKDAILVVDLDHTWILYNQKFIDLWHISDEVVTAKNDSAALSSVLNQLEFPDIFLSKVQELYATPEASSFDIIQFKDGKIIERYSIPQWINEQVVGRVWSFRDVTENKLAEQQLNNLQIFNKTILDQSPAGIAVYLGSGSCIMANDAYARTVGATVEDMLQQDFRSNASWKTNGLLDFANQAFETGTVIRHDIEGTTSFGKRVALECIFSPIDISGKRHLLVITNDISERIKSELALNESMHKLEEKELAKTRFLAAAGHDLRQPLAAANLFIDALKFTGPTTEQNQILQRLDQAMINFNGLLEALLNISKLDAGIIKPEYTSINVTELCDWLEENFSLLAAEKKLGFKLNFPMNKSLTVRSDIGLVKSVLMNLVSNAIKFTAKGSILISARQRGDEVLFQVWDTGIGIQDEQIEHIFDEFYQVNNPQRDRTSGLGLGLAIARRALILLNSQIICRSQIGQGSVFEFSLPLDTTSNSGTQQSTALPIPKNKDYDLFTQGKRFVIIEDDALVAEAMGKTLVMMGGEVECFHHAEDALCHPNIGHADYYIVDYMLGGTLNGIQCLNQFRDKFGKRINAVLVTGDTSPTFVRSVANCGWPVLHKPVSISNVLDHLRAQVR
jgi:PAS domain S-box-containing protein